MMVSFTKVIVIMNNNKSKRYIFILLFILIAGLAAVVRWEPQNTSNNKDSLVIVAHRPTPDKSSSQQICKPKHKLGFLKMHKCASSTLENVFFRYAYLKNLNVILPMKRERYLGSPEYFSLKLIEDTPWHHLGYDIMTLHTRWNHSAIKEALGGNATFVTMIREPAEHFESIYGFYNFFKFLGNLTLPEFIDKLENKNFKRKNSRPYKKFGRNQMLFDLGFPVRDFDNEDKVKQFVKETVENFNLVMVIEKMEESIVLLKHLLCWDYQDLVFLKLNARAENEKEKLSVNQKNKLRKWLKADNLLYSKLREIFDQKVEQFGRKKMEEEKEILSLTRNQIVERCLSKDENLSGNGIINEMRKRPGCRLYALRELNFMDVIKAAQWKRADEAALKFLGFS